MIDDAPSQASQASQASQEYSAIGSLSAWSTTETIPGPAYSPVKQVEQFNIQTKLACFPLQKNHILMFKHKHL